MNRSTPSSKLPASPHSFQTTRWSMVLDAAQAVQGDPLPRKEARQALEDLCRSYWYPLYAFARRQGRSPEDATDATQAFFADLLEKSWIDRADPALGRFRSYLITVFRRFLNDQRKRTDAAKRGGGIRVVSIDTANAEQRYQLEPIDPANPADAFERQWAMALLDRVYALIQNEYVAKERGTQFEALRQYLTNPESAPYAVTAAQLGMTEANVKVSVHRLRVRFAQLLKAEVAQTVESSAEVASELNALLVALSRGT